MLGVRLTQAAKSDLSVVLVIGALGLLSLMRRRPSGALGRPAGPSSSFWHQHSLSSHRDLSRSSELPISGADPKGRRADSPGEIPARGWKDILKRTIQQTSEHRLMTEAAGITFYAILAIFPALAALVSLYGLIADPTTVSRQLGELAGILPGGATQIIGDELQRLTSAGTGKLGIGAVLGLVTALWSANGATKAMFDALNVVYDEREKRGFIRRTGVSLAVTIGILVATIGAMLAVVAVPVALGFLGLGRLTETLLLVLRWPLLLVLISIVLSVLYRFGPSRTRPRWRWVSWGGAFAATSWLVLSAAFSWYVANFGTYNKTYGALGAVIGFMTWIWLSATVFLVGAELNAETEHQTERDSTVGPPRPLGTRGATKADTVAES